jgi:glyoxylase-like metal-dependent hydrolase (beta-lactamase superfamily II)
MALDANRRYVGGIEIIAVTDGVIPTDTDKTIGLDAAECKRLSGHAPGETFSICVNQYVVRTAGKTLLIDAGAGVRSYPGVGLLPDNLRKIGISPDSIDAVLLTHLHSDHMHGLVDADGRPNFPNAELVLHEEEANFWIDKAPTGNPRIDRSLQPVERNTRPYRERLRTVRSEEVFTGVSAHLSKGHTPGHTTWRISAGREQALMWGDTIHFETIQIPRPDVAVAYDMDPDAAAIARRAIFEMCVSEDILLLGAHISFPGFGRLERRGTGYALRSNDEA